MKRLPLTTFFVLAFALPWLVWGTQLVQQHGLLGWHLPGPLAFWVGLPLATYGAAALTGGRPAVRDLLSRLVRVRVGVGWYAAALLVPPVVAAVALTLGRLLGNDATTSGTSVAGVAGLFVFNSWMWLLTEETAWRGYAQPRLEQRFGPVTAWVVLGAVWACWHLPLFLIAGTFQSSIPFVGFAVSTVATSVLIGAVFDGARGSVLVAALCHAASDVTIATTGVMTSGAVLFWVFVTLQVAVAVVCVLLVGRGASGGLWRSQGSPIRENAGREVEPHHA